MPAPCTMVPTRCTLPWHAARTATALTWRTRSGEKSSALPRPTTTTLRYGVPAPAPRWRTAVSPRSPLNSPRAMRSLMRPPSLRSTAPVAPPGRVTPSNRFTMMASTWASVMLPCWTTTSMVSPPCTSWVARTFGGPRAPPSVEPGPWLPGSFTQQNDPQGQLEIEAGFGVRQVEGGDVLQPLKPVLEAADGHVGGRGRLPQVPFKGQIPVQGEEQLGAVAPVVVDEGLELAVGVGPQHPFPGSRVQQVEGPDVVHVNHLAPAPE